MMQTISTNLGEGPSHYFQLNYWKLPSSNGSTGLDCAILDGTAAAWRYDMFGLMLDMDLKH